MDHIAGMKTTEIAMRNENTEENRHGMVMIGLDGMGGSKRMKPWTHS